ncbi:transcriptional regulator ATRX homolog [Drosophila subpulchrella]|uniref:transcriptional regulator ATRX homolog n=1 Tax=Drosophila subpulchrella TaxID=1486046 RepID=UPI0018A172EB|nr:transcriptional regulator ATRX homolog [Drosophila subpulchrella]
MAQRPKKEFEDSSEEENEKFKNWLFSDETMKLINAMDSEEEEEPSTSRKRKKKRRRKSSSEDAEQEDGPSTSRKRKKKRRKKSKSRDRARMAVEDPEIDEPIRVDTSSERLSPCAPVLEPSANIQVVDFNGVVEPSEAEGPGSSMASQEKSESPPSKAMECEMSEESSSKVGEDPTNPTYLPRGQDPETDEPLRNDTSSGGLSPWVLEPSANIQVVDFSGVVPPSEAEGPGSSMASQEKSESPPSKEMECEMSEESSSKVGEDPTNPTYLPRGQDPEDPEIDEPFRNDTSSGGLSPCAPVLEPSANIQVVDFNGVVEPSEAEGPGSSMASQEKSESPPSKEMECVMSEASSSKVGEGPTNPTGLLRGEGNDQNVI